jgi:hypothetical protein
MEHLSRPTEVGDRGWDNAVDAEKRDCGGGGHVAESGGSRRVVKRGLRIS